MYLFKLGKLKAERFRKIDWILASGLINKDVWLAGGALRTLIDNNDKIVDYDLFFRGLEEKGLIGKVGMTLMKSVHDTRQKLTNLGFKCTFECPEGKLYTYEKKKQILYGQDKGINIIKVQLITEHFYSSPEELLSTFDLSPTYFCTDGEYLWTNKKAIFSVKKKICDLIHLTYPVSTFNRIIKYYDKEYCCLPAIQKYVDNLIQSNASKFTEESMRVYID